MLLRKMLSYMMNGAYVARIAMHFCGGCIAGENEWHDCVVESVQQRHKTAVALSILLRHSVRKYGTTVQRRAYVR